MYYTLIDYRGNKESIEIINTNQEDILKALPERYHKDFMIKISREKNKIYALPLSTHANGRPSITEIVYLN